MSLLPRKRAGSPVRLPANIPSPLSPQGKTIKAATGGGGLSASPSSPGKTPKSGSRIARPVPGVAFEAPMVPERKPAAISNVALLKASIAELAVTAPSPSSPSVRHWFVGESRRCLAWVMDAEGPVSSMRLETAWPVPSPAPGEVRVKVRAVGLSPADCIAASTKRPTYPHVLGLDVAGDIDVVGPGVVGFEVGDAVYYHGDWNSPYGGYAEYAIGTIVTLRRIPEGMSYEVAASLPSSGWTAQAMISNAELGKHPGQTVYIPAGAGGVGCFAIQLAKLAGATVITTCGNLNVKFMEKLGADHNFNYRGLTEERIIARIMTITDGKGINHWFDTIGSVSAESAIPILQFQGTLASCCGPVRINEALSVHLMKKALRITHLNLNGVHRAGVYAQADLREHADVVEYLVSSGQLDPCITEYIDMKKLPNTLERLQQRHCRGKTIMRFYWSTSSEADVQQRNLEYDPPRTPSPVLDTNTWPLTADSVDLTEGDRPWTGKRIGGGVDELLELEDKKAMETTSAAAAEPSASTAATDVPQPPADPELPEIP